LVCIVSVMISGPDETTVTAPKVNTASVGEGEPFEIPEPTPRPIAPSYHEIAEKVGTMTEAQWKTYLPTLEGNAVISWRGFVEDVNVKPSGAFELLVDMDTLEELFSTHDVVFDIADDAALEFEIDQVVIFSGTINRASEFLGTITIYLDDVSLEN